eukprot:TRINITY_DN8785_c0_g2_i1.p1 TRINITY_DN8785_c0_g2~~TRINITY_DN8785_c0_g2_i1.p1  ORF type:complete len:155 (+),score=55.01 TRINITY_DN8785_c0_g2_i1:2-466(+)
MGMGMGMDVGVSMGMPLSVEEREEYERLSTKRMKRLEKNKRAARQSRMKRKVYMESLEEELRELREENRRLREEKQSLQRRMESNLQRLHGRKRMSSLESSAGAVIGREEEAGDAQVEGEFPAKRRRKMEEHGEEIVGKKETPFTSKQKDSNGE